MTQQRHVPVPHVTKEVVRQMPVQVVQQIDVPFLQPFVQTVEEIVEVRQVHMVERPYPVPVVVLQVLILDVPVVMPRQTPMIRKVPKTLEARHVQFIDRIVDVLGRAQRQVPSVLKVHIDRVVNVPVMAQLRLFGPESSEDGGDAPRSSS